MMHSKSILITKFQCLFCGEPVSPEQPGVLQRVTGFESDSRSVVIERHDEFAHEACIERMPPVSYE